MPVPTALKTRNAVTINAPIQKVWEAITTPKVIKQWFFRVDTETDWKEGSPIIHRGEWQGKPYEDKGRIVTFDPPRKLVHTHWSPTAGVSDDEENYETVSWELAERDGRTELTINESNLPSEQTKSASDSSWQMALEQLKKLLED